MLTFQALIEDIGGVRSLAEGFSITESHARVMKTRNSIPPEYWPQLIKMARAKRIVGVNVEALLAMRAQRKAEVAA